MMKLHVNQMGGKSAHEEDDERFVEVKEAAEHLGLAPASIYRIIRKGHAETRQIVTYKMVKTKVNVTLVSLDDLEQYREKIEKFDSKHHHDE